MNKFYCFLLLLISSFHIYSQNLLEEKFKVCDTDYFTTESDSIIVRPANSIEELFFANLDETIIKNIEGVLALQVIVDENGKSCLLSIENTTNISTQNLNLKTIICENLIWHKPKQKTSVILGIKFYKKTLEIYRIGIDKENGFHFIKK